jgi:GPH family glycoside/pentoside/hexuronide:cation symporter
MAVESTARAVEAAAAAVAAPAPEKLKLRTKILYGAPSFAGAAMAIPILIHMPKFYADVVLAPLGYLAIAIALARASDALTDPVMGWITDRTKSRWGRRRPWIALGAPLCALAFWALLSPPVALSGVSAALWFGSMFILYFLFHTVYILPHYALGPELTLDYHERSSLFAVREAFLILGTIVASAAPGLLVQRFGASEREAFFFIGVGFAVLLTLLYLALVVGIRERPDFVARESNPLIPGVRRALRNKPFRILLMSYVVASITGAIPATLVPFFNAYVIRPDNPTLWLSYLLLAYFGFGFMSIPFWLAAARRFGKLNTWLASFFIGITAGSAMFLLGEGDMVPLLFLMCYAGIGFGAGLFLAPSMQADVIDYDEFHTGKRREAQYGAFWSMLPKFVAIPSAAIPIAILATIGYVPNAVQTPEVLLAIRVIYALAPAASAIAAFIIARHYPITAEVHREILGGIEAHRRGENAIDPLTGREVSPPNARGVDEATGWFLDYFSAGELKRYLHRGAYSPVRDVYLSAGGSMSACLAAVLLAGERMTTIGAEPGAIASLAVVGAGIALATFMFHVVRLGPARRLAAGLVSKEQIIAHLKDGG